jgi:hypothetical protein
MADLTLLDRAFVNIRQRMIRTGQAPHYTELARELGLTMEEGRQVVHALMASGFPGWTHPGTDYIASFPPFNNQPTQYRITVEGEQKWFAQCGFEALAIRWLFPGKVVRVNAPCVDCGESIALEMRDEQVLLAQPDTVVGYAYSPIGGPPEGRPFR